MGVSAFQRVRAIWSMKPHLALSYIQNQNEPAFGISLPFIIDCHERPCPASSATELGCEAKAQAEAKKRHITLVILSCPSHDYSGKM